MDHECFCYGNPRSFSTWYGIIESMSGGHHVDSNIRAVEAPVSKRANLRALGAISEDT